MKKETMDALIEAGEEMGIELTAHEDYSGRCMYGRTTCAVSFDDMRHLLPCVALAAVNVAARSGGDVAHDEFVSDLRRLRQDDLGRGTIIY